MAHLQTTASLILKEGDSLVARFHRHQFTEGYSTLHIVDKSGIEKEQLDVAVNGKIHSLMVHDNSIYFGGNFSACGKSDAFEKWSGYMAAFDTAAFTRDTSLPEFNDMVKYVISDRQGGYLLFGQFGALHTFHATEILHVRADGTSTESVIHTLSTVKSAFVQNDKLVVSGNFSPGGAFDANSYTDSIVQLDLSTKAIKGITNPSPAYLFNIYQVNNEYLLIGSYYNETKQLKNTACFFDPFDATKSIRAMSLPDGNFSQFLFDDEFMYPLVGAYLPDSNRVQRIDLKSGTPTSWKSSSEIPLSATTVATCYNDYIYLCIPTGFYDEPYRSSELCRVSLQTGAFERMGIFFAGLVHSLTVVNSHLIVTGKFNFVNENRRGNLAVINLKNHKIDERHIHVTGHSAMAWLVDHRIFIAGGISIGGSSCGPLLSYDLSDKTITDPFPMLMGEVKSVKMDASHIYVKGIELKLSLKDAPSEEVSIEL